MDDHKIDFENFEPQRLLLGAVQSKKSKPDPAQNKKEAPYQQANFVYLYKLPNGQEIKGNFLIELCRVKIYGIRAPEGNDYKHQVQVSFDKTDPKAQKCIETLMALKKRMIELISEPNMYKNLKANHTNIKDLVYFPKDKITNENDPNRNPTQFFKLMNYTNNKTHFVGPAAEPGKDPIEISWDVLMQAEFSGKPLIKYTHIYCNGNTVSPQSEVYSMAVDEIKDMASKNLQRDTIQSINPDAASSFAQQLAKLQAALPDKLNQLSVRGKGTQGPGGSSGTPSDLGKKSEPLTSNPTDISNFMSGNNFQRTGPTQTFAGNINPQFQQQPAFQGQPQFQAPQFQQPQFQGQPVPQQNFQASQQPVFQQQPAFQGQPQQQGEHYQQPGLTQHINLPPGFNGFGGLPLPQGAVGTTK